MRNTWMKAGVLVVFTLFFMTWVLEMDAWARAGGGRSMGSRGSRSYSSPSRTYTSPQATQPAGRAYTSPQAAQQTSPMPNPAAQPRPGFWRTFGAGALGGILGGMLFSSFGHGAGEMARGISGSGIGLFDILLIGALLYGIYWFVKQRRQGEAAAAACSSSGASTSQEPPLSFDAIARTGVVAADDLAAGLAHIRSMDPSFDEKRFSEFCTGHFVRVQGAWANRDMTGIRALLTEGMYGLMQAEAENLRVEKKINRLDNIAVRSVEIAEAWQEQGQDFVTVRFLANLLDYTTSESGELISGSKTDPVKFEEFWTYTRPVGGGSWQLSGIHQAE